MRRAGPHSATGYALAELVSALALGALLALLAAGALSAIARRAAIAVDGAAGGTALHIATFVLSEELRYLVPQADLHGLVEDSISVRALRALAVPCAAASGGAVLVRARGLRQIEPDKDSALWIAGSAGAERALGIVSAAPAPSGCAADAKETVLRLELAGAAPEDGLLLVFERGSYHLADRALRYRRGGGGRQPLTLEWLDDDASGFAPLADAVETRLKIVPPGRAPAREERITLRLWNALR